MSRVIDALREMLNEHLVREGSIVLRETASTSTCKDIKLERDRPSILLHPDSLCEHLRPTSGYAAGGHNERLLPYFNPKLGGLSSLCDYIIIASNNAPQSEQLYVLLCELKSGRPQEGRLQVENGRLLAEYILRATAHHSQVVIPQTEYRAVVFSPRAESLGGDPRRRPCRYRPRAGKLDLCMVYYKDGGAYPLSHFLV